MCKIRGKFRTKGLRTTNPIAVGDHVEFTLQENEGTGIITDIKDRKNVLLRKSTNLSRQSHIIAANIDYAVLIASLIKPVTYPMFIDRYLVACEANHIDAAIVFNKLDLLEQSPRIDRDAQGKPERVWLSAATGEGVDLLLQAVSELIGQDMVSEELELTPEQGGLRAALYRLGAVESENYTDDGMAHLQVRLPRADWNRLMKKGPEPLF